MWTQRKAYNGIAQLMKEEVNIFLESNLLEEYLLGLTDSSQSAEVERMLVSHPEVQVEYDRMQDDMESYSQAHAVAPPLELKAAILAQLDAPLVQTTQAAPVKEEPVSAPTAVSETPVVPITSASRGWMAIAASLVAVVAVVFAIHFYNQQQVLLAELDVARQERTLLAAQLDKLNNSVAEASVVQSLAYHPKTTSVLLRGNTKAEELGVVAYWNPTMQKSFLNVLWLPEMEGKCFQLWADVQGEMISLGVLDPTQAPFAPIDFKIDAESLNITIEPEGGSDHPTVTDLVSSIAV